MLATAGERIPGCLCLQWLFTHKARAHPFTGSQAGFMTDTQYGAAHIRLAVKPDRSGSSDWQWRTLLLSRGFKALIHEVTLLLWGAGGSDTSAVAFGLGFGCRCVRDLHGC